MEYGLVPAGYAFAIKILQETPGTNWEGNNQGWDARFKCLVANLSPDCIPYWRQMAKMESKWAHVQSEFCFLNEATLGF